jgi:hypothetical protein
MNVLHPFLEIRNLTLNKLCRENPPEVEVIGVASIFRGGSFLQRGVVLSNIPDFHGQFKKKIMVSGIPRSISKIFFQRAPLPTPMEVQILLEQ